MTPDYHLSATGIVDRIVDGDTIEIREVVVTRKMDGETKSVPLSWTVAIRLLGMDAPGDTKETKEAGFLSGQYLSTLIPRGTPIYVEADPKVQKPQDLFSFGRLLGHVFRRPDMLDIDEAMIEAGHAEYRGKK